MSVKEATRTLLVAAGQVLLVAGIIVLVVGMVWDIGRSLSALKDRTVSTSSPTPSAAVTVHVQVRHPDGAWEDFITVVAGPGDVLEIDPEAPVDGVLIELEAP